ncbi:FAD-dependent oxidoreductase [Paenibacillus xerothermodurans]|uniref:FAD-dependent oxidoreductase n=1 Tax=Paenibacillus xerothermodurans TaxID=1977292 RepID=A0A2W1NR69_PAEXE|nr:FAD-dependent oxidoreductase [Paenibacillus xerothermodurans]PZE21363.1 FAD-dependent oxidoreductase [Paenibacillus xerothermodurans]
MKRRQKRWSIGLALFALIALGAVYSATTFFNKGSTGDTAGPPQAAAPQENGKASPPAPTTPAEDVDVVVFGSELEGLYLARAAADEGLKVKVLDPHEAFGGQVLQGEMLFLDEARDDQYRSLVQGRAKELFDGFRSGKIRKLSEFTQYFDKLSKDIPVESGITIQDIKQSPGQFGPHAINAVTYSSKDGDLKTIKADYWVDNTDFAALLSKLEVNRLPGLEKFYGQENIEYMSAGMMMKFKNVDWAKFNSSFNSLSKAERSAKYGGGSVNDSFAIGLTGMTSKYKPTNDRVFLRGLNAVNQRDGEVLINAFLIYTVDPSDDKSVADAMELGKKELPLILDHFRKNITGWEHAELNGYPDYLYIREYNHYETDYVLKPSDMLGAKMFWDNVSIGGYPLDLQGTSANKWGIEMGRPDKYGMPLRSFLLKNYDNVIVAGKNVGASAIAYGSARIQPNTSLAAETIGVLLGQLHDKKKLRELQEADMPALHSYLENKYKIKLTGVTGKNKIASWTSDEIAKLDTGEIVYASHVNKRKK